MAAKGISCVKAQRNSKGFTAVLSSTLCEWILIFLLFIDALLSYLLMKFSRYCKLQPPCPLCSRLDHVLGDEEPEFYHDLLCKNHRLEVSSLISCQIHDKLADVHDICDECLFSSIIKKSSSETQRLLVGKLGVDLDYSGFQIPFPRKESVIDSPDRKTCSCCYSPWRPGQIAQRLLQLRPTGARHTKPDIPLHRPPGDSHLNHRDNGKKKRDKVSRAAAPSSPRNGASDHLSHVGYSMLKFTSDSEPEVPLSDDENMIKKQRLSDDDNTIKKKKLSDDDNGSSPAHGKLVRKRNLAHKCAPERSCKPLLDDAALGEPMHQASSPVPSHLDSYVQTHVYETHTTKCMDSEVATEDGFRELSCQQANHKSSSSALHDFISLPEIPPSSIPEVPPLAEVSIEKTANVTGTSITKHVEAFGLMSTGTGSGSNTYQILDFPASFLVNCEFPIADASCSNEIRKLQKSVSLGSYGSGKELLSRSTISDLQDENDYQLLKYQAEHYQRCERDFLRELEEERNASAVAANQAMAMITRLQEEKAAVHMEALQYLRMMEEQAEYDVEALEKANDLLAEREKDIQDLEAELEFYRKQFGDRPVTANEQEETCDLKMGNGTAVLETPWSEFEDEKQYISECLRKLEMRIQQIYPAGASECKLAGQDSEEIAHEINKEEELNNKDTKIKDKMEEKSSPKNNNVDSDGKECPTHYSEVDLFTLENEVSDLKNRLEELEVAYHFLENTLITMQNGDEGLEYVQEIARQLREIQKIAIEKGCQSIHRVYM